MQQPQKITKSAGRFRPLMQTFVQVITFLSYVLWSSHLFALTKTTAIHPPKVVENPEQLPTAEFSLKIDDIVVPYSTFSVFVLPKQKVDFEILFAQTEQDYCLSQNGKIVKPTAKDRWIWSASQAGTVEQLVFASTDGKEKITINAFVKVPAEQVDGGKLNYFHIGPYPQESEITNKELYVVPDGFIEVTEENKDLKLSAHFRLKEFISKQRSSFPKYVYLQPKLLLKLERIRQELNLQNIPVSNMVIMSGYRTPYYNKAIGNVKFSRHVFGDAADIFIDNDGDYRMDDINQDGKQNRKDAELLASVIESMSKREINKGLIGGVGIYGPKPHRGAFVHVDTRGVKARW